MNMHDAKKMNGDLTSDMEDIDAEIERELNALSEKDIEEWEPENIELQDEAVDEVELDGAFQV